MDHDCNNSICSKCDEPDNKQASTNRECSKCKIEVQVNWSTYAISTMISVFPRHVTQLWAVQLGEKDFYTAIAAAATNNNNEKIMEHRMMTTRTVIGTQYRMKSNVHKKTRKNDKGDCRTWNT